MKKVSVFVFLLLSFCVLQTQNISFVNTLEAFSFGSYSLFCEEKLNAIYNENCLQNGDVFIYGFDSKEKLGECVKTDDFLCLEVQTKAYQNIKKYLQKMQAKKVKTESVCGVKIDYYFCEKLSKKTMSKDCVFNLVVAAQKDSFVMGYPAIMGSL